MSVLCSLENLSMGSYVDTHQAPRGCLLPSVLFLQSGKPFIIFICPNVVSKLCLICFLSTVCAYSALADKCELGSECKLRQ